MITALQPASTRDFSSGWTGPATESGLRLRPPPILT